MRLFKCAVCAQLLYFEATRCESCGHLLGYEPSQNRLLALEAEGDDAAGIWRTAPPSETRYRFCSNATYGVCNWLIDAAAADTFCLACRHNGIIPDLS